MNAETHLDLSLRADRIGLQWGRVLMNAETHLDLSLRADRIGLQWGRVLMNAETSTFGLPTFTVIEASMGPRSHERGNVNVRSAHIHSHRGFNGAAFS